MKVDKVRADQRDESSDFFGGARSKSRCNRRRGKRMVKVKRYLGELGEFMRKDF